MRLTLTGLGLIGFITTTTQKALELIVLCNFQPTAHKDYYIGVPEYGIYDEVFNSDDPRYGGSGVSNGKDIKTVDIAIHGYNQAIKIKIPPLSVSFIKLREKLERPIKAKSGKKKPVKKKPAKKKVKTALNTTADTEKSGRT